MYCYVFVVNKVCDLLIANNMSYAFVTAHICMTHDW